MESAPASTPARWGSCTLRGLVSGDSTFHDDSDTSSYVVLCYRKDQSLSSGATAVKWAAAFEGTGHRSGAGIFLVGGSRLPCMFGMEVLFLEIAAVQHWRHI